MTRPMRDSDSSDPARDSMLLYLEGALSPAELDDLERELQDRPELLEELAGLALDRAQLFELGQQAGNHPVLTGIRASRRPPGSDPRIRAAAALVIIAGILVLWSLLPDPETRPGVPVEVHLGEQVVFADGDPPLVAGRQEVVEPIRLVSGRLTLRSDPGVELVLRGPGNLEFLAPLHVRLDRGKVTATAEGDVSGFTVETPAGRILDLGTRFGVTVDPGGTSEVVVFDGEVELREAGNAPPRLRAGEALRLSAAGPSRISSVITGLPDGDWATSSEGGTIASVTDNVAGRWSHRFYPVLRDGMREGVLAWPYTVNQPRWWSRDGRGLPEDLRGADVVQVLQQELENETLEISLRLARPARVFVFHEKEAPRPAWLERDFERTGEELRLSPDAPRVARELGREPRYAVRFEIWRRDVPRATTLSLGAVRKADENSPPFYMYGIAARPLASGLSAPDVGEPR